MIFHRKRGENACEPRLRKDFRIIGGFYEISNYLRFICNFSDASPFYKIRTKLIYISIYSYNVRSCNHNDKINIKQRYE